MRRVLAGLLALLAGCSRGPAGLPQGQIEKSVISVKNAPPCDSVIPMEWPATWPVPTGGQEGREFKLLFYPMSGRQGETWVAAPLGEAVFVAGAASASSCRRLTGEVVKVSETLWSPEVAQLGMAAFDAESEKLYAALSEAAPLYAAKRPLGPAQAEKVRACGVVLTRMIQPSLAPDYYRINPDFWEWLRSAGAPSLSKP